MRLLIQRVKYASVTVNNVSKREISNGLCVFIAVTHSDTEKSADYLAEKLVNLRIFEDNSGKINLSLQDISGELLLVSQFSLYANCQNGRRPGFTDCAQPDYAEKIYDYFVNKIKNMNIKKIETGEFGADMLVEIHNDGPLTFIIDSPLNKSSNK